MKSPGGLAPLPAAHAQPLKSALKQTTTSVVQRPTQYHILLSGYKDDEEKAAAKHKIESLGGFAYMDGSIRTMTHVVALEVIRSPKMVAALCFGKWIVRRDWLDASVQAGYFVDEENYEWVPNASTKPGSVEIESACRKCRERVAAANGRGFFLHTPVILFIKVKSKQNRHMLEQCGFEVLQDTPPFRMDLVKVRKVCCHTFYEAELTFPSVVHSKLSSYSWIVTVPLIQMQSNYWSRQQYLSSRRRTSAISC
jgi:hypothetical protein